MALKPLLSASNGELLASLTLYQQMVGALQHESLTKFDISFPKNLVSQFTHQPRFSYLQAVKCIYWYLASTVTPH